MFYEAEQSTMTTSYMYKHLLRSIRQHTTQKEGERERERTKLAAQQHPTATMALIITAATTAARVRYQISYGPKGGASGFGVMILGCLQ